MYRYLTTLLLAGVAAVILTATPANAFHKGVVHGGGEAPGDPIQTLDSLDCTEGEIARFIGGVWVCSGTVTNLQDQIDDLLFFIVFDGRLVFVTSVSGGDTDGNMGGSLARTPSATTGRLAQGYLGRIRLGSLIRRRRALQIRGSPKPPGHTCYPMVV